MMELITIQVIATVALVLGHFLDVVRNRPGRGGAGNGRVLCYDNTTGRGDHKHFDEIKVPYRLTDLDAMQADFSAYAHLRSLKSSGKTELSRK